MHGFSSYCITGACTYTSPYPYYHPLSCPWRWASGRRTRTRHPGRRCANSRHAWMRTISVEHQLLDLPRELQWRPSGRPTLYRRPGSSTVATAGGAPMSYDGMAWPERMIGTPQWSSRPLDKRERERPSSTTIYRACPRQPELMKIFEPHGYYPDPTWPAGPSPPSPPL